jgi:type IV pilus assembly protein PilW
MNLTTIKKAQTGFSLIEIMIGMLIGLIAALVITNVFAKFEQQKRITTGGADAQTNGAIAIFNMRRDAESAGYGLPMFESAATPLRCPQTTTINHDNSAATATINLTPLVIVDGGAASDQIAIRYGTAMKGGAGVQMTSGTTYTSANVETSLGCSRNDIALAIQPASGQNRCSLGRVTNVVSNTEVGLSGMPNTPLATEVDFTVVGNRLACLGAWNEYRYAVNANYELTRTGALLPPAGPNITPVPDTEDSADNPIAKPMVTDVVNIQAQYGVSVSEDINTLDPANPWVNATGIFGPGVTLANRNRIKAVRMAVIARSALRENQPVSQACNGTVLGLARVCIWNSDVAPSNVDLTAIPNWQNYRYKVYETVVPLRNVMWNQLSLKP